MSRGVSVSRGMSVQGGTCAARPTRATCEVRSPTVTAAQAGTQSGRARPRRTLFGRPRSRCTTDSIAQEFLEGFVGDLVFDKLLNADFWIHVHLRELPTKDKFMLTPNGDVTGYAE